MNSLVAQIDRAWYSRFGANWDDQLFREKILAHVRPDSAVLDLGAGAGIVSQMNFRGRAASICGVDLDPRVLANPFLDEGRLGDVASIPYKNACFDLAFSDNVLEHLKEPLAVFREVTRVLKPGGLFLFKTPNKWHYAPTIARWTPHGFHQWVNRLRGRHEEDTFPSCYRANSKFAIHRLANQCGLSIMSIERFEGRPEYMRLSWPTYVLGAAYERLVNANEVFAPWRVLLIGILRKPFPTAP
jgi:SAM-dependent methyltransferase